MATVLITKELITATTSNYCNDDYNGDGEEVAEVIKVADDEGTEDEKNDDGDESDELLRPRQMA